MPEPIEITPDIDSPCRKYGHVEIGGELYRIPRLSMGPYGDRLRLALDEITGKEGKELITAFYAVFNLAMSRFYNNDTAAALLDSGNVTYEEVGRIIAVIQGTEEEPQKKSLPEES